MTRGQTGLIVGILLLGLVGFDIWFVRQFRAPASNTTNEALPSYTVAELASYNGDDPAKPVYLAYEGQVYDVSAGRAEFYDPGQPYHYLCGQDATKWLQIAGGKIVKEKYPIVGRLVQ